MREYADVFKTVCVNAAYYAFPSQQYLERLAEQFVSKTPSGGRNCANAEENVVPVAGLEPARPVTVPGF